MKEQYIEDLKEIRDIMHRSTRFISLSGLSGMATGLIALTAAYLAYKIIFEGQDYLVNQAVELPISVLTSLLITAIGTLILAAAAAIFFTTREARKRNQRIWDHQSKRLVTSLSFSLVPGGLVCLLLLLKGYVGLAVPLTLIFYGLALVNSSRYTLDEIRSLGIAEIILGLIAVQFIHLGLALWALGFGVLHIVYGFMVYWKYES